MDKFNFGENLRKVRLSTGISQEAMALMLHISQKSYSRLEHRSEMPSEQQVMNIGEALGVHPSLLRPPAPQKTVLAYPLKELLSMRGGGIIAVASGLVIVISAHGFAEAIGYEVGLSTDANRWVRILVAVATGTYIFYKVKAIKKG